MTTMLPTGQGHEVLFLPVSAPAAPGDTTIIPADAITPGDGTKKRKIRIFCLILVAKAATVVTFKSNTTAISGPMTCLAGGLPPMVNVPSAHILETAPGEAFVINTSADGVYGFVGYTLEPR